jgi:hypothetical protein
MLALPRAGASASAHARVVGSPAIGGITDEVLCTILAGDGREFSVPVGAAVPNLASWLACGAELWACATPAARTADRRSPWRR